MKCAHFSKDALLVNDEKEVVLAGYASVALDDDWQDMMIKGRWMSPESIFAKSRKTSTTEGDVYSFAMTCLEVSGRRAERAHSQFSNQIMTGDVPFAHTRHEFNAMDMIVKGVRPARPDRRLIHHGLDDRLWNLMSRCWAHDPSQRPTMVQVHEELLKMRELPVLTVCDLSDMITLKSHNTHDVHACGAFGDIRLATLKDFGPVALKTVNVKGQIHPELRLTKVRFT